MGYFSLVGLLRVHCLLGEYETALKALGPIQPFKTGSLLTPKVAGANIALYYYAGFSYLMLQRYLDATRSFNIVLNYINRSGLPCVPCCILFQRCTDLYQQVRLVLCALLHALSTLHQTI